MSVRLALEWSSPRISVAVDNHGTLSSRVKDLARFRLPEALSLVEEAWETAGVSPKAFTELRIGRGPGNYTGVRQAIAFAQGFAAPGKVEVFCVSSGVSLASALSIEGPFWVLGDARRDRWWGARFPALTAPEWMLKTPEEWKTLLEGQAVFSSEPHRLTGLNVQTAYPEASNLLSLPRIGLTDPLEPLYLHQAV